MATQTTDLIRAYATLTGTTLVQARSHNVKPTLIGMLRDLFDSAEGRITSKHLPAIAEKTGMHPTTVRLQYYRWRAESNTPAAVLARTKLDRTVQ